MLYGVKIIKIDRGNSQLNLSEKTLKVFFLNSGLKNRVRKGIPVNFLFLIKNRKNIELVILEENEIINIEDGDMWEKVVAQMRRGAKERSYVFSKGIVSGGKSNTFMVILGRIFLI